MVKNNNRPDRGNNRKTGNAPQLSAEEQRTLLAKQLRIKPKTKAMVDMLADDKTLSQTEAYIRTHKTESRATARNNASKTLAKTSVRIYSDSIVRKAKTRVGQLVDSENESIALKASQDIIDRTEGKAQQKDSDKSRTVTVKLDLTGVKLGNHYLTTAQLDDIDT
jgi:ribosomal protein S20